MKLPTQFRVQLSVGIFVALGIFGVLLAGCSSSGSGAPQEVRTGGSLPFNENPLSDLEPPAFSDPEFQMQRELKMGNSALRGIVRGNLWNGFSPLIDTGKILRGGPPPDGIPSIDNPSFLRIDEVDFLDEEEPVISLTIGGETRAYPIQIMTWHEIVNNVVGGVPVTVTYCPLCNSALAYNRQLGNPASPPSLLVDFGTSGFLFNSSLVMYDRQTETLWTHFDGMAVVGELEGLQLEFFPLSIVSWSEWKEANPQGMVLNRVFGSSGRPIRDYGRNPYAGYLDRQELFGGFLSIDEIDDRLPPKTLVVGVGSEGEAVAVNRNSLAERGVVSLNLGDVPISVWHLSGTRSALDQSSIANGRDIGAVAVFESRLDGRDLEFRRQNGAIIDVQTGSEWNIFGRAVSGELAESQLIKREFLDTFWFAWAGFNPETRILD